MLGEMPGRCWGFALYKEAISSDPSVAGQDLLYLPTNYLWTHSGEDAGLLVDFFRKFCYQIEIVEFFYRI